MRIQHQHTLTRAEEVRILRAVIKECIVLVGLLTLILGLYYLLLVDSWLWLVPLIPGIIAFLSLVPKKEEVNDDV